MTDIYYFYLIFSFKKTILEFQNFIQTGNKHYLTHLLIELGQKNIEEKFEEKLEEI